MAFVLWGITIGGLDYWNDSSNLPQNASVSARQKVNILSYFAFSSIMPGVFRGQKGTCIFNKLQLWWLWLKSRQTQTKFEYPWSVSTVSHEGHVYLLGKYLHQAGECLEKSEKKKKSSILQKPNSSLCRSTDSSIHVK